MTTESNENDYPRIFMAKHPRYYMEVLDSSAVTTYKHCPRKFFFNYVLSRKPNETPPYFSFGSAYHMFREVLEKTGELKDAYLAGNELWRKEQPKDPDPTSKWGFLNEVRLNASFAAGFKQWEKEKANGNIKVVAIEQPFVVEVGTVNGHKVFTCGRADQIVEWNGRLWGRDFKTSSKDLRFYERGIDPNDQFTRYTYAESQLSGREVQGQLIEVLYNDKRKGPEIKTFVASRQQWQIEDWKRDELFWRASIERSHQTDTWPKNEKACTFCEFHMVCRLPSEQSQLYKLQAEFKVEHWDPSRHSEVDA